MQQHLIAPPSGPSPYRFSASPAHAVVPRRHRCLPQSEANRQFIALLDGYRDSGGLARTHELLALAKRRGGPAAATLANWVAERDVISFEWQSQIWLPLFQFARPDLRPPPELARVLAELTPVCDPWELAAWFVQPNPWLANRTPLDALASDLPAVLDAARAERFVVNG